MTLDDVKKVYAAQLLRVGKLDGFDAVQATRTLVKAMLQEEKPVPYPLPPGKNDPESLAKRKLAMRALVSPGEALAFERARRTPEGVGCRDAHHFVQRAHQIALWEEANVLVKAAVS